MKRLIRLLVVFMLTLLLQSCAVYTSPYSRSAAYYGYGPSYGFSYGYWPYYRPYRYRYPRYYRPYGYQGRKFYGNFGWRSGYDGRSYRRSSGGFSGRGRPGSLGGRRSIRSGRGRR